MLDQNARNLKAGRRLLPGESTSNTSRQRRGMLLALLLLLVSLVVVLYRDRDFWFPDAEDADSQPLSNAQGEIARGASDSTAPGVTAIPRKKKLRPREPAPDNEPTSHDDSASGATVTAVRTVLPPLEVEVIAGDARRTVRPGTNAVHVDLQGSPSKSSSAPTASEESKTAARVTTPAAQRASVSNVASADIVSRSIQPDYPMLARQMRVQGSVVLQALIGRDGLIQDLRVLSGPPILANAAEEAVRQWHFKPHYMGAQAVETRANITVNFTISTN